jgi:Ala-tRNA(Pro) deacylase
MTTLQRCMEFLESKRIPYTHSTHPPAYCAREVAYLEHVPAAHLAKTIVFCGDDCYAMAVLPADRVISVHELATSLGLLNVRLVTEIELAKLFPQAEVGAMPPLGKLFNLPVYVDENLAKEDYIVFNAGTHRDAIHMKFSDFRRAASPVITHFAQRY